MHEGNSDLCAVVMLPKILADILEQILDGLYSAFDCKQKYFSLRGILIHPNDNFFFCFSKPKHRHFLALPHIDLR